LAAVLAPGLYIVATPLGNLGDLSARAAEVLRQADLIACEDTRQTRKLLAHLALERPTISYHEHNEAERTPELLERLRAGLRIALVSDAGTPLISDPGYRLVRAALDAGILVVPIPGPSAVVAALSAAGLRTESFYFGGFLPHKQGERRRLLETLGGVPGTLVFYEAPHRIVEALADIETALHDPPVVIARELTKVHEEFLRGAASEVRVELQRRESVKGEITLLIGPRTARRPEEPLADAVRRYQQQGLSPMEALKRAARERGMSKREAYRMMRELAGGDTAASK